MRALIALAVITPALSGAALPQDGAIRAAAECRLPRAEMIAALKTLPVQRTLDRSEPPGRDITQVYKVPAGLLAHGFAVERLGSADIANNEGERLLLMAMITAPYADVERAVLAARPGATCGSGGDVNSCFIASSPADGWRQGLLLKQYDDNVAMTCTFTRIS